MADMKKTRTPARWMYCPPVGKVVSQKFLPLKTPLDNTYDHLVEERYRFHPQMALSVPLIGTDPGVRIGLWIDLTNTTSYYSKTEIEACGCVYKKLRMLGHAEAPTIEQTQSFIETVDEHLKRHPKDIIAVHCTHGFNRTGFLIAAYLHDREDMSIEMAVEEFAACRPHGIYKQHYLDELVSRYGDDDEELKLEAPERPLWENTPLSDEEYANGVLPLVSARMNGYGLEHFQPSTSSASSVTSDRSTIETPKFMDGLVPGVVFVHDVEERVHLQKKIQSYCNYKRNDFPGSQPVSLEGEQGNNNIEFLAQMNYMVSWKADGVRYLVLIEGQQQIYAFDRDNNVFRIPNIVFPKSQTDKKKLGSEHIRDTLLDAEMVIDQVKQKDGSIEKIPRLLIYDIIRFQDREVNKEPFHRRFKMIETELIQPRTEAFCTQKYQRSDELMSVRRKDFYHIAFTHKIFRPDFQRTMAHEVDGLIFQPDAPYKAGRFDHLLKWKPPELSSIDFKLRIQKIVQPGCLAEWHGNLYVLGLDTPFATIKIDKTLKQLDEKIIECAFDKNKQAWVFMRERTDKSHPNAYATAKSVCNTIKYPIDKNRLLKFIEERGYGVHREIANERAMKAQIELKRLKETAAKRPRLEY